MACSGIVIFYRFWNPAYLGLLIASLFDDLAGSEVPLTLAINEQGTKKAGLRLELGMEQMFWSCMSLRLDYVYTRYSRMNFGASVTGTAPDGILTGTLVDITNIRPINHSLMLGLSYYW